MVAMPQPVLHCMHGDLVGQMVTVVGLTAALEHPHGSTTKSGQSSCQLSSVR
jgi:hypothetical protein